jgi:hypothetical protein
VEQKIMKDRYFNCRIKDKYLWACPEVFIILERKVYLTGKVTPQHKIFSILFFTKTPMTFVFFLSTKHSHEKNTQIDRKAFQEDRNW